jgi:hypothetical protein
VAKLRRADAVVVAGEVDGEDHRHDGEIKRRRPCTFPYEHPSDGADEQKREQILRCWHRIGWNVWAGDGRDPTDDVYERERRRMSIAGLGEEESVPTVDGCLQHRHGGGQAKHCTRRRADADASHRLSSFGMNEKRAGHRNAPQNRAGVRERSDRRPHKRDEGAAVVDAGKKDEQSEHRERHRKEGKKVDAAGEDARQTKGNETFVARPVLQKNKPQDAQYGQERETTHDESGAIRAYVRCSHKGAHDERITGKPTCRPAPVGGKSIRNAFAMGKGEPTVGDLYIETRIPLRPCCGSLEGKPELASEEQARNVGTNKRQRDDQRVAEKRSTAVRGVLHVEDCRIALLAVGWLFRSLGMKHFRQPTLTNISKRGDWDA